jgi:hypothetical protein
VQSNGAGKLPIDVDAEDQGVISLVEGIYEALVLIPLNRTFVNVSRVPQLVNRIEIDSRLDALIGHPAEQALNA